MTVNQAQENLFKKKLKFFEHRIKICFIFASKLKTNTDEL